MSGFVRYQLIFAKAKEFYLMHCTVTDTNMWCLKEHVEAIKIAYTLFQHCCQTEATHQIKVEPDFRGIQLTSFPRKLSVFSNVRCCH